MTLETNNESENIDNYLNFNSIYVLPIKKEKGFEEYPDPLNQNTEVRFHIMLGKIYGTPMYKGANEYIENNFHLIESINIKDLSHNVIVQEVEENERIFALIDNEVVNFYINIEKKNAIFSEIGKVTSNTQNLLGINN